MPRWQVSSRMVRLDLRAVRSGVRESVRNQTFGGRDRRPDPTSTAAFVLFLWSARDMSSLSVERHVALFKAQTCLSTPSFEPDAANLLREFRGRNAYATFAAERANQRV